MRKFAASVLALGTMAAAGTAFAGMEAATGINGSVHDMTVIVGANADSMGRVCVFCHTPHHAQSNKGGDLYTAPLWNRTDSDIPNYTPYQWITPANQGNDSDPDAFVISDPLQGPSRLCMSCHDGVLAVDSHGQAMAQAGAAYLASINSGRASLGYDLTQTHPIGFNYVDIANRRNALATNSSKDSQGISVGSEIVDPENGFAYAIDTNAALGTYNTVSRYGAGHRRIKDVLFKGTIMTCASCHEVHNKENATQNDYKSTVVTGIKYSGTTRPNYFLYAKQDQSLICLSCHVK
jgi:hypothetical protein